MAQKLNQVIAIEKQTKSGTHTDLTTLHRLTQTPQVFTGMTRTYRPRQDDDVVLPGEQHAVQLVMPKVLAELRKTMTQLFDVVATKDEANTLANADVVVDGATILSGVPATTLLFLEKQLVDLHTFMVKLPQLDPAEEWSFDPAVDAYRTRTVETTRTQKVPRNHVKAEATDKHPAQVEVYHEDVVVGYWDTVKFSGALPAEEVKALAERVTKLLKAVKYAREEANTQTAEAVEVGDAIFGYLLAD